MALKNISCPVNPFELMPAEGSYFSVSGKEYFICSLLAVNCYSMAGDDQRYGNCR